MTFPTYEEAEPRAVEGSPFSNCADGEAWMDNNCRRCVHDAPTRRGEWDKGCPLVLIALLGQTPAEWLRKDGYRLGDQYTCLYYRNEDDGPGPQEPAPIPDPPGQLTLCPREPFERPARMFADTLPQEVAVHA
ncbi:hypothetical protein [Nonomuraea sp. NPDC050310]|uniref:hypothetical protein n=1 Tax=Nonomuraea sp. NPDC050310 TaxID=3154935 RepID=UPI0033D05961